MMCHLVSGSVVSDQWRQAEFDQRKKSKMMLSSFLALLCASSTSAFSVPGRNNGLLLRHGILPNASPSSLLASSAQQDHALEVFSLLDADNSGEIDAEELGEMLRMLDIDASDSDAAALFKYLAKSGNRGIGFNDFAPWYADASSDARSSADAVQAIIRSRRAVRNFDQTPVSDDVLRRAIECAIAAPNRSMSEPWRFIQIGRETVGKIAERLDEAESVSDPERSESAEVDYLAIPGWCVITSKRTPDDPVVEETDFASTACAVQNFMLSMWSEGIGTRWMQSSLTQRPGFSELCGVDLEKEKIVGCIWYGFVSGGVLNTSPWVRKNDVDEVYSSIP